MKKLRFKRLTLKNFLSVGSTPLVLDFKDGLNLITGYNRDDPTSKNGIGKCLDPKTEIDISIDDEMVLEKFENFVKKNNKSNPVNTKYLCRRHKYEDTEESEEIIGNELGIIPDEN